MNTGFAYFKNPKQKKKEEILHFDVLMEIAMWHVANNI